MSPHRVVEQFEAEAAQFLGAPHVVAVDSCTAALWLCCLRYREWLPQGQGRKVTLPRQTYIGVVHAVLAAGLSVRLRSWPRPWQYAGSYPLSPLPVIDSACDMQRGGAARLLAASPGLLAVCYSCQYRKPLPIGRGGLIGCQTEADAEWFRAARWTGLSAEGRLIAPAFNCKMEPERAARGLSLLEHFQGSMVTISYPDLGRLDWSPVYGDRVEVLP